MAKKILIVDDEGNSRASLADILEKKGYVVIQASNAEEGMDKARNENPDLVLLDTVMPGINGIEACRRIKKVEKLPCKVIIYTGKINAIDAVESRRCGVDDYCMKGRDPSLLLDAIKDLIES